MSKGTRTFQIYRYDPDKDAKPYMQTIKVQLEDTDRMLLDALVRLKKKMKPFHSVVHVVKACAVRMR